MKKITLNDLNNAILEIHNYIRENHDIHAEIFKTEKDQMSGCILSKEIISESKTLTSFVEPIELNIIFTNKYYIKDDPKRKLFIRITLRTDYINWVSNSEDFNNDSNLTEQDISDIAKKNWKKDLTIFKFKHMKFIKMLLCMKIKKKDIDYISITEYSNTFSHFIKLD